MITLKMTKFETLETKVVNAEFSQIEESFINFFGELDEIKLKLDKCFAYKNGEIVGGAKVSEYERRPYEVFEGDVFFADLGEYDGTCKQCGVRPVIVVSNNICNENSTIISVVPLTSQERSQQPTHVVIQPDLSNGLSKSSTIKCEQITSICKTKLISKIGHLENRNMQKVKQAIKIQLDLD